MRHAALLALLAACKGAVTPVPTEPTPTPANVVINELMASNATGLQDESGAFPDWIELHNTGDEAADLSAWFMTDDGGVPQKWSFPDDVVIPGGGYLIVFADDDPSTTTELHASFKLSAGGEALYLVGPVESDLELVDSVEFGPQTTDVSWARVPNGTGDFEADGTPTPGAANDGGGAGDADTDADTDSDTDSDTDADT
ncbi:MAG: lamin tail domain-containing protein, partial [Myxococcales bacterium]|nr:lamin tail domain-containing protein [Myxococcales bacterium]